MSLKKVKMGFAMRILSLFMGFVVLLSGCSDRNEPVYSWNYLLPKNNVKMIYQDYDFKTKEEKGRTIKIYDVNESEVRVNTTIISTNMSKSENSSVFHREDEKVRVNSIEYESIWSIGSPFRSGSDYILRDVGFSHELPSGEKYSECVRFDYEGDTYESKGSYMIYCKGVGMVERVASNLFIKYLVDSVDI